MKKIIASTLEDTSRARIPLSLAGLNTHTVVQMERVNLHSEVSRAWLYIT